MKRSPLKRTKLKPKSDKQIERDKEWAESKKLRIAYLTEQYGGPRCEYERCLSPYRSDDDGLFWLGAHHIDGDRLNNTPSNVMLLHNLCHTWVTDNNEKVVRKL